MEMNSVVDVQQLYRQWQDGKLLENEERQALHLDVPTPAADTSFAEILRSTQDPEA